MTDHPTPAGAATGAATGVVTGADPTGAPGLEPDPRRWRILGVIAITQLMLVLDGSIMNIALPSAAEELRIADNDLQWAITAYTLAFGGLLLLGGRVADYLGRKRAMLIGLVGFAVASAIGGAATNAGMLFGARALQGVFGALLAPAALALVTVTFTEPRERAKAFGVFGAISGGGAAIGLIAGGALTEFLDWRWCLFVNLPIALVTAFVGARVLRESKAHGDTRFDIPGALLSTFGLLALVYGFTEAARRVTAPDGTVTTVGWTDPLVVGLLVAAVVLLTAFVLLERKVRNPLLPLRIVLDRNRGGSYAIFLLIGAGLMSMFLFMTLYFQYVMGYEPLRAGFAFLPFSLVLIVFAGVVARLLPQVGPKPLMVTGLVLATVAMLLLTRTQPDSDYWTTVFPALVVLSLGMAMVFIPVSSTALVGVGGHDAGVASAMLNTSQQVGASLGIALLNTLALAAASDKLTSLVAGGADPAAPATQATASVAGYHVAFLAGAVMFVIALLIAATVIAARRDDLPTEGAAVAA
ncbi:MFS transporter [Cellulomonas persica]|uniref:MFS transporter n=1 Tax=Cellulomonas persica TaxID=76861 RepID=A0A510UW37_9CELL|nr:MFS transporter [Cellulomonas persica]GEK18903.1 MFS transporter [Cellulomonas persica]